MPGLETFCPTGPEVADLMSQALTDVCRTGQTAAPLCEFLDFSDLVLFSERKDLVSFFPFFDRCLSS